MVKAACQNSEGLPLAVQVIGRRYQEEKVLRVLRDLEERSQYGLAKRVCDVKTRIGAEESFETNCCSLHSTFKTNCWKIPGNMSLN